MLSNSSISLFSLIHWCDYRRLSWRIGGNKNYRLESSGSIRTNPSRLMSWRETAPSSIAFRVKLTSHGVCHWITWTRSQVANRQYMSSNLNRSASDTCVERWDSLDSQEAPHHHGLSLFSKVPNSLPSSQWCMMLHMKEQEHEAIVLLALNRHSLLNCN